MNLEKATFGAGCFWGVEAAFKKIKGVTSTAVGYMGGSLPNATYEAVCKGNTGHAEVVQIEYNPRQVSYEELLKTFWDIHDPTTLNRQGPDIGTQYRSVVFHHTPEQEKIAQEAKEKLKQKSKVVTEITKATDFWRAEEYHQRYFEKMGISH